MKDKLRKLLLAEGVSDVGFGTTEDDGVDGMNHVLSVVVRLSDAVIDGITDQPTHAYFHHYRTVNAFLDRAILKAGLCLQQHGFRYFPVAASQSINTDGKYYEGLYSHKKAAVCCGLGGIGKNSLFLHKDFGPSVRLGTLFTDCDFGCGKSAPLTVCDGCDLCVKACPAMAIKGVMWHEGISREEMFDPRACSEYMKKNFQQIGRGAVCGICIRCCPKRGGQAR